MKPAGNGEKRHEKASIFTSPPVPWCHGAPAAPARQGRGAGAQAAATAGAIASRSRDEVKDFQWMFHEFSMNFQGVELQRGGETAQKRMETAWFSNVFKLFGAAPSLGRCENEP